ncbi:MAG: hypothetical protein OXF07_09125 [Rhodobacter sp.]|nr:hypothetical protein [Rhodobacter sp.]MCY4169769.1 hypothetical protein [Rhodobacter sp.]MCY4243548.1 hypothetical protein [Rhodobacter sp.]
MSKTVKTAAALSLVAFIAACATHEDMDQHMQEGHDGMQEEMQEEMSMDEMQGKMG